MQRSSVVPHLYLITSIISAQLVTILLALGLPEVMWLGLIILCGIGLLISLLCIVGVLPFSGCTTYVLPEEKAAWKQWRKNNPGVAHLTKEQQRRRWLSERTAAVASYDSLLAKETGR